MPFDGALVFQSSTAVLYPLVAEVSIIEKPLVFDAAPGVGISVVGAGDVEVGWEVDGVVVLGAGALQFGGVPVCPAGQVVTGALQFGGVPVCPAGQVGVVQFGGVPI